MGDKLITITDRELLVGKKAVAWTDIVGVRRFTSFFFRQMSSRGIFCELFIRGGGAIRIFSKDRIEGTNAMSNVSVYDDETKRFHALLELIEKRAVNLRQEVSNWIEWRLLLPVVLVQLSVLLAGIIMGFDFTSIVDICLIGGLIALPCGYIWEKKVRKNKWQ